MITPMLASAWAKGVGLPAKATTARRKTTSKVCPARRTQTRPAPPASSAIVISRRATRWGLECLLPSNQAESECGENRDQDDGADLVLQPDVPPKLEEPPLSAAVPRRNTRTTQKSTCSAVRSRGIGCSRGDGDAHCRLFACICGNTPGHIAQPDFSRGSKGSLGGCSRQSSLHCPARFFEGQQREDWRERPPKLATHPV